MTFTNQFTKDGIHFVHVGQNLVIGRKRACNVSAAFLWSLGYHQVVIIETDDETLTDGWLEIEGLTYWADYQLILPDELETEPE